jgi:hypothetical protein
VLNEPASHQAWHRAPTIDYSEYVLVPHKKAKKHENSALDNDETVLSERRSEPLQDLLEYKK